MNETWLARAARLQSDGIAFVAVNVLALRGSAPAELGRRLLVTAKDFYGSIGGGRLEEDVLADARAMLADGTAARLRSVALGPKLGQCCGGNAVLHFELFAASAPTVAVFGAGHTGGTLVRMLGELPYQVVCIDARPDWLAKLPHGQRLSAVLDDDPAEAAADLPRGCCCAVMTPSHATDLGIASRLLAIGDAAFVGVIGSATKGMRFRARLSGMGLDLAAFACPIGKQAGKHPAEVAAVILAELVAKICSSHPRGALGRHEQRLLAQLTAQHA